MDMQAVQGWLRAGWQIVAGPAVPAPGIRAQAGGILAGPPGAHTEAIRVLKNLQPGQGVAAEVAQQQANFGQASPWPILIGNNDRAGMITLLGLVHHGLTLSAADASSLLINACNRGWLDVVNAMLGDGVNQAVRRVAHQVINWQDTTHHRTAIRWASKDGHKDIIRMLIANGARATLAQRLFVSTELLTPEQMRKYTVIEHRWRDNVQNFYRAGGFKLLILGSMAANVLFGPAATGFLLSGGYRAVAFTVNSIYCALYYLVTGGLTAMVTAISHLTSLSNVVYELGFQAIAIIAARKMNPLQYIGTPVRYLLNNVRNEGVQSVALVVLWVISSTIGFGGIFSGVGAAAGTAAAVSAASGGIGWAWTVRLLPAAVVAISAYIKTPAAHPAGAQGPAPHAPGVVPQGQPATF